MICVSLCVKTLCQTLIPVTQILIVYAIKKPALVIWYHMTCILIRWSNESNVFGNRVLIFFTIVFFLLYIQFMKSWNVNWTWWRKKRMNSSLTYPKWVSFILLFFYHELSLSFYKHKCLTTFQAVSNIKNLVKAVQSPIKDYQVQNTKIVVISMTRHITVKFCNTLTRLISARTRRLRN